MRKYILLFLLLIMVSCSVKKEKEKEPNNTKWRSQLINIPLVLSGQIDNKDIDYYKFIICESETNFIDIELSAKNPNPLNLSLYFQNTLIKSTHLLEEDYENKKNKIVFKNIALKQGVYYIKIIKNPNEHEQINYLLNIKLYSYNKNIEKEPNDKLVEANAVNITNGYVKGFFNPAFNLALPDLNNQEADWFKFYTSDKTNVLSIEITSIPDIDPVIELYNNLGFLIKKADSLGIDEPEILKNFGIYQKGEYYIKVYNKNINYQNDTIPYQLYLNLNKINSQFEMEPNDSLSKATPIQTHIKGYINPVYDIDWYTFFINEKKSILNISITPLSTVNLKCEIFNHIGEKIYTLDNYPDNEAEIMPNLLLHKGQYYLSISDKSNQNQNYLDYYTLTLKINPFKKTWEYEPNNSFENAINININHSYEGYISPAGDKDFFIFNINNDQNIKIDVSPIPQIDFIIIIYDTEKNIIKEINSKPNGYGETATLLLKEGTYYIILKDADKHSNFYENYIFSIYQR